MEANSAIFCWQGQVLASISVQVLATRYERGPSTVVRRFHNAAMDHAAHVVASRLSLSGFYGLDFILDGQMDDGAIDDQQTGTTWLLEMNSRATQIAHLALGLSHDLPAAAFAAVTGRPVHARPVVTTESTIALFQQEWQRDAASQLLPGAYHDVPWEAPTLVRAYVNQRPGWRRLLTQQYWQKRGQQKQEFAAAASETTAPHPP
jgi:hypothetical protein